MTRVLFVASVLLVGCGTAAPQPTHVGPAGTGPAYSSLDPGPELERRVAAMTGSCNFAPPPGKAAEYPLRLRAQGAPNRLIHVRADAVFRGPDRSNVIGHVAPGTIMYGRGPVKASEASPGIGYAVLVRDSSGRVCRGYVHARTVKREPI